MASLTILPFLLPPFTFLLSLSLWSSIVLICIWCSGCVYTHCWWRECGCMSAYQAAHRSANQTGQPAVRILIKLSLVFLLGIYRLYVCERSWESLDKFIRKIRKWVSVKGWRRGFNKNYRISGRNYHKFLVDEDNDDNMANIFIKQENIHWIKW